MVHKALKLGLGGHFGQLVQNGLSLLGVTAVIEAGGLGVLPQEYPEGCQLIVCLIHGITSALVCRGGAGFIPYTDKLRDDQHGIADNPIKALQIVILQRKMIEDIPWRGEGSILQQNQSPNIVRTICSIDIGLRHVLIFTDNKPFRLLEQFLQENFV